MESIIHAIWIFGFVRLAISIVNYISYLYAKRKLRLSFFPFVSILIPARNEEKNIGLLLNDLLNTDYTNIEIIVYDDQSDDQTAKIVQDFSLVYPHIKLIEGDELPNGWLGKPYACHQLATHAQGEKLLFLDADVRIGEKFITHSLAYMERYRLALLSVFPRQIMPSWGSRISVPLMNWILLSLLPLPLVRLSNIESLSAANGQCMFFDAKIYNEIQPHLLHKNESVEDMAIVKSYKRQKQRRATLSAPGGISCRMYENLHDAVNGFSKNIFDFFGGKAILGFLFAFVTTFIPLYLLLEKGIPTTAFYLLLIIAIRLFISLASRQPAIQNIFLILPQQLIFWVILINALYKRKQKNITWKDRNISSVS